VGRVPIRPTWRKAREGVVCAENVFQYVLPPSSCSHSDCVWAVDIMFPLWFVGVASTGGVWARRRGVV